MLSAQERVLDARLILAVVACAVMSFAGTVVETAMNVAFPALMEEFSIDTGTVQWVTTAYLLVLTCIMPVSSILKRRFRTKSLFAAAIVLFACGTAICAVAPTFAAIVAGRVIEGVGTGLALPLMFNIILEQAPPDKVGVMMGIGTLVSALGPAAGPSLGGFVIGAWGWRMVFVSLLPLLAFAAAGGMWAIRQASALERVSFSAAQFLLLSGGFACLVFGLSTASDAGWLSVQVLGLLAAALVLFAAFALLSSRSADPLIRVRIFRVKSFTLSVVYVVILQAIILGLGYLIPYYGQVVLGLSEFAAGCLLLPGCLIGAALAPLGGRILDKVGALRPLMLGASMQLAGTAGLFVLGLDQEPALICAVYSILPAASGIAMGNTITNGVSYLERAHMTDGNAVFSTMQQLGGAVGTAVAASIMNGAQAAVPGDVVAGTMTGAHLTLLVMLAAAAVAFLSMVGVFAGTHNRTGE